MTTISHLVCLITLPAILQYFHHQCTEEIPACNAKMHSKTSLANAKSNLQVFEDYYADESYNLLHMAHVSVVKDKSSINRCLQYILCLLLPTQLY